MLVIMGEQLNQNTKCTQGILRFHHLRNFLQLSNNLIVHRGLLHRNTNIHTKLISQHFRLHMIAGACNHPIVEHFLHTLVNSRTADATLFGNFLEWNTGALCNNFQNLTV